LSITEKVWGFGDSDKMRLSPQGPTESLIYTSSDTNRLEALGQSRRGSDSGQERHNLSLALRVVGDYLDRHRAVAFDISWAKAVRLNTKALPMVTRMRISRYKI